MACSMDRRAFLRGSALLAGWVLVDGIWQRHRKVFALGGLSGPLVNPYRFDDDLMWRVFRVEPIEPSFLTPPEVRRSRPTPRMYQWR